MPVTPSFRDFALDQLGQVTPGGVRDRPMFGGVGVYAGEYFFAILDDDALYLKADDESRNDFIAARMRPFMPFGEGGEVMSYYRLPPDVLEEVEALSPWVALALAAAQRKRRPTRSGRPAIKPKTTKPRG
jgi:DNA transformation protein